MSEYLRSLVRRPATITTNNALLWGLAWLIAGAIIGWHFSLVPTSLTSYTWGYIPLLWHLIYALVLWITSCVAIYAIALTINRRVAITELFGRMLFAHWPVVVLMVPGIVTDRVAYSTYMSNVVVSFSQEPLYATLLSVVVAVVVAWYIFWGYCAFSRSVQRSDATTRILYIVALVVGFVLSTVTLSQLSPEGGV